MTQRKDHWDEPRPPAWAFRLLRRRLSPRPWRGPCWAGWSEPFSPSRSPATFQADASAYVERYDVIEDDLTRETQVKEA